MKQIFSFLIIAMAILVISCNKGNDNKKNPTGNTSRSWFKLEEGFVDAHGVLIYYKALGQGKPLVILHGGPGASHDYLLPYLLPLATVYPQI
jgi:hypothetical protein